MATPGLHRDFADLALGTHLCRLYAGPDEFRAIVTPFVLQGIRRSERVLVFATKDKLPELTDRLERAGIDTAALFSSEQLGLYTFDEAIRRAGSPEPQSIFSALREEVVKTRELGFHTLRICGDMSWAVDVLNGPEAQMDYEARLNEVVASQDVILLCLYDRTVTDPVFLLDLLAAHPFVADGDLVYENFHFRSPVDFLEKQAPEARLEHWLASLAGRAEVQHLLLNRLSAEKALAEVSRTLITQPSPDFSRTLAPLARQLDVCRAQMFVFREDSAMMDSIHEWCAPHSQTNIGRLKNILLEAFPWSMAAIKAGDIVSIPDVALLPPEADPERGLLLAQGIKAILCVPLLSDTDTVLGYISFCDTRGPRPWSDEDCRLLRIAAETISAHLACLRTQRALENSEARFRSIFETAHDIIFTLSPQGLATSLNPAFERILGWPRNDWIGRGFSELTHADDRETALTRFKNACAGRSNPPRQIRNLCKSGRYRILEWVSAPLILDGRVQGVAGVARDVSERLETEKALRDSRETAADIVASVPSGFFTYRYEPPDKLFLLDANARASELVGFDVGRFRGREFNEIWPLAKEQGITEAFLDVARSGKAVEIPDVRYEDVRVDGSFRIRVFPMPGARIGVAFENIADLKNAQQALKDSQENYQAVFNAVNDAVLLHDAATGDIIDVNSTAEIIYGYTTEELKNLKVVDLSEGHPPYSQEDALRLVQKAASGEPQLFEWLVKQKNGRLLWVEVNLKRASISGRDCVIAVVRDVDSRKRLERQLLHSQKMEALGRVTGGVAHGFNNFLAAITGYAELALSRLGDRHPSAADLAEILDVTRRAGILTRQLLTFSRKQPMEPKPLSLNTVIGDIELMLRQLVGSRVELITDLAPGLHWIVADQAALEQVIVNLAINSRDAMPDGGVLHIRTANVLLDAPLATPHLPCPPGSYVELTVSDNGLGMDENTLARAFEPFFTTKEIGKGTGLGLATVYAVVKQFKGGITFSSTPGGPSSCGIYFPPTPVPQAQSRTPVPRAASQTGKTVLLAEDSDTVRRFTAEVLSKAGYKVLPAADGAEALRLAASHDGPLHLLITDVLMPGINGRDLAARLAHSRPEMKVVFTSGFADSLFDDDGLLRENITFVPKPFTVDELLTSVRDTLAG